MRKFDFLILNKQSLQVGFMSADYVSKSKMSEALFLSVPHSQRKQTHLQRMIHLICFFPPPLKRAGSKPNLQMTDLMQMKLTLTVPYPLDVLLHFSRLICRLASIAVRNPLYGKKLLSQKQSIIRILSSLKKIAKTSQFLQIMKLSNAHG